MVRGQKIFLIFPTSFYPDSAGLSDYTARIKERNEGNTVNLLHATESVPGDVPPSS